MPGEKDFQDTTLTNTQGPCRNSCFYLDSEPTASTVVRGESTATSPVESIAPGEPTVPGEPKASVAVEAVKVVPAGQAIETVNQAVKLNSFF